MVVVQHSQNACYLKHGQLQNLSKILRNLSALLCCTPDSFPISRCVWLLYALSLKGEYTDLIAQHWTHDAETAWNDLKEAIISDPCIQRFDHRKLVVLRSDFSSLGFGYVLLQPGNDEASVRAAQDYRAGNGFSFMTKGSTATLRPICFGARMTRGNEVRLHSHLGEGFSGDYAINKCRQYVFGQRFVG